VMTRPVLRAEPGQPLVLEEVVVEIRQVGGRAVVHLTPAQARAIEGRLTTIGIDYLHENSWGGEDARTQ
jgi:hypothetical protein